MNQSHHQQSEMYYPQYPTQQYNPYPYPTNGAHTPAVSTPMPGPQNVLPVPSALSNQGAMPQAAYSNNAPAGNFDTTGQHNPPGMKPRVTATLWEDEGSLCFQVEARGICVARREGKQSCFRTPDVLAKLTQFKRQPYDQWYQATKRRWYDSRASGRYSEE
jgi:protein SOK2